MKKILRIFWATLCIELTLFNGQLAFGVIAAGTAWEVRPGAGASTAGMGFSIGVGTATSLTDLASDAATPTLVCSQAHGTFASDVGKWIKFTAGTGATFGFYYISGTATTTACTGGSATGATLDRSVGGTSLTSLTASLYPGIDRSQQNSAQTVIDNSAITATTTAANSNTLTFTAGYTPTAADIGNIVHITAGTNMNFGWYEITAETSTTWTLTGAQNATTAGGAGSAITGNMGGAADKIESVTAYVAGNRFFVKAGTYSTSGITLAVAGAPASNLPSIRIEGYTTTRGDSGQVTITPSGASITGISITNSGYQIANFKLDGTGANAWTTCITDSSAQLEINNINCDTFTTHGIRSTGSSLSVINSIIQNGQSGCISGISGHDATNNGLVVFANKLKNNSCTGASGANIVTLSGDVGSAISSNLIIGCTGVGILFDRSSVILNNTIDGCTVAGIQGSETSAVPESLIRNNLLSNNAIGLELWTSAGWKAGPRYDGNCYYNNTANRTNSDDEGINQTPNGFTPYRNSLDVVLGSTPYADNSHTNDNFAITNTSGAFQAGTPGALPGVSQTGSMSCGALTPLAPLGSSGSLLSNSQMSNSRMQ